MRNLLRCKYCSLSTTELFLIFLPCHDNEQCRLGSVYDHENPDHKWFFGPDSSENPEKCVVSSPKCPSPENKKKKKNVNRVNFKQVAVKQLTKKK